MVWWKSGMMMNQEKLWMSNDDGSGMITKEELQWVRDSEWIRMNNYGWLRVCGMKSYGKLLVLKTENPGIQK